MRPLVAFLALALTTLAACVNEPEPVANRFDRTNAEIENKANALEASVENQVRTIEADTQREIDALADQANLAAPAQIEPVEANGQ
jgi:hypothetical protein